ncbi:transcription factor Spi-C isoform X2 [Neoarius graeffei]|uniref:transcription factor Spi-C isoform X2 n=1 Tax=Neoarius graeffei TaxID=443677 RepID=UPI00298C1CA2|nr:transcription factor Spi-C isoform X2 [Neoarius graeffei]
MGPLDNDINQDFQDAIDVMQRHSEIFYYDTTDSKYIENIRSHDSSVQYSVSCYRYTPHSTGSSAAYDWGEASSWSHITPEASPWGTAEPSVLYPIIPERLRKGRKKLRLYEYLHEALHDASMVDSIQWTDRGTGTFHFISKNKEKLAECWGQRKGNRKAMTYQKMARALRNYSRTGEIVKVRRKLTYQFNPLILQRLETMTMSGPSSQDLIPHHQIPAEQGYYCSGGTDWHSWYAQCPYPAEYDFTSALTSTEDLKTHNPSQ